MITLPQRGWTPLMYAVQKDQLEIVTKLVDTDVLEFSKTNKVSNEPYNVRKKFKYWLLCSTERGYISPPCLS